MRRALLTVPAALALLLSGCIVDSAPGAERETQDADARPETDADRLPGSDADLFPGTDAELIPGPDAELIPEPDAELIPEPDAGPQPDTCAALCAARAAGLQPEGGCPLESFRTPGISYDCTETCARAQVWTRGMAEAARTCVREEYLCFETLEGCAIRLGTLGERLTVTLQVSGFENAVSRTMGVVTSDNDAALGLVDFDGSVYLQVEVALERLNGLALWLWLDDGDGTCQPEVDRFAVLWLSGLEQLGGAPEDHPLATGRMHQSYTLAQISWNEHTQRQSEICALLRR